MSLCQKFTWSLKIKYSTEGFPDWTDKIKFLTSAVCAARFVLTVISNISVQRNVHFGDGLRPVHVKLFYFLSFRKYSSFQGNTLSSDAFTMPFI